jgi:chromosome segregation ATPase
VSESEDRSGIRARGEEALGDLAQALLDNPLFSQALKGTLGAGERAAQAQRSAMGALNVASGAELERIERRLRSASDRLEGIEDQMDELLDELTSLRRRVAEVERRASDQAGAPVSEPGASDG